MRRRLFTFFSGISTLLCVAACVLWVRNQRTTDFLWYGQVGAHIDRIGAITEPGVVTVFADYDPQAAPGRDELFYSTWQAVPRAGMQKPMSYETVYWHRGGFSFRTDNGNRPGGRYLRGWNLMIPHWFLVLTSAVAPVVWLSARWSRVRNESRGLCTVCGYDLRATPERCPECGSAQRQRTQSAGAGGSG